jgi:hypothetical protein
MRRKKPAVIMGQASSIGATTPPSTTMPISGFDLATVLPTIVSPSWIEPALRLCSAGTNSFYEAVDFILGAHESRLDRFLVGYQAVGLVLFIVISIVRTLTMCFVPAKKKKL